MSAPAHTPSPADAPIAVDSRLLAVLDRALPFLGPALALALGVAALGRRSLDVDEASAVAAAQGSFSHVVEQALSHDPARAGYLALLQPVVAWNDGETWIRLPSVLAVVLATVAVYRLGRRLSDRRAGATAALVLASSLGVVSLSRSVGPLALALAAMLLSSALFARALERGNAAWWAVYAVSAALLPLTHPIAASALAAQILALVVARHEVELRLAVPAIGVATLECTLFLVAAVIDRADAVDGAGPLGLREIGEGVGRALGWSPVVAGLAVWGMLVLHRRSAAGQGRWKAVLVAGLAAMPLAAVLVAGVPLPVYPATALTVSAGGIALGAGVGAAAILDRGLRFGCLAAVAAVATAALVTVAVEDPTEDWRSAVHLVGLRTSPRDTVVVLPARARAAFAYYAPDVRTSSVGRGEAVTVVVAGAPGLAITAARQVVSPPRYALLSEQSAGSRLVVQRWVRP